MEPSPTFGLVFRLKRSDDGLNKRGEENGLVSDGVESIGIRLVLTSHCDKVDSEFILSNDLFLIDSISDESCESQLI